MINPHEPDAAPDSFSDRPLQPTGSGVADLEIAYEQMKLTEENEASAARADVGTDTPSGAIDAEADSEAHPS